MLAREANEAYRADRSAALAGVPKTTVYYWANHDVWVPSVSAVRTRYWSLADVLALRAIYWLRSREKTHPNEGIPIGRTKMREVRRAMREVRLEQIDLARASLFVDLVGHVFLRHRDETITGPSWQTTHDALVVDVLREFSVDKGLVGPDLAVPRPTLRIIPGKLSGEPHVAGTRIRTLQLDALLERGYLIDQVREMYPFLESPAITEARDLELQLRSNLRRAA